MTRLPSRPTSKGRRVKGATKAGVPAGNAWEAVYDLIRAVPCGRVATYGQIARLSARLSARAVGWVLHVCPPDVPWHRIVNVSGRCSTERLHTVRPDLQRALLESEGVTFCDDGSIDLEIYRWDPDE